jgi:hypothetical protein
MSGNYFLTEVYRGDVVGVKIVRIDDLNLATNGARKVDTLCEEDVLKGKSKKLSRRILAKGSQLKFLVNGKVVCSVSDKTYKTGYVGYMVPISAYGYRDIGLDTFKISNKR